MRKNMKKNVLKAVVTSLCLLMSSTMLSSAEGVDLSRINGKNRYDTSIKISQSVYDKSENVIIASGQNFADALSGSQLSFALNAPILLSERDSLSNEVQNEIKRLGAKNVYILGGRNTISDNIHSMLAKDYNVTRIGGLNRYKTSEMIMKKVNEKTGYNDVVLVSGENFADALSSSSYIYKNKSLLMLSTGAAIPKVDGEITAIGGVKSLKLDGFTGKRIAGKNRYETALMVAKMFGEKNVIMASGETYPDALTAVSLIKKQNAPMLLVRKNTLDNEELSYLKSDISNVTIVGGENTISSKVENMVRNDVTVKDEKKDEEKNKEQKPVKKPEQKPVQVSGEEAEFAKIINSKEKYKYVGDSFNIPYLKENDAKNMAEYKYAFVDIGKDANHSKRAMILLREEPGWLLCKMYYYDNNSKKMKSYDEISVGPREVAMTDKNGKGLYFSGFSGGTGDGDVVRVYLDGNNIKSHVVENFNAMSGSNYSKKLKEVEFKNVANYKYE